MSPSTSWVTMLATVERLERRSQDDNETIGELARAVNELQEDRLLTIKLLNRTVQDVHELRDRLTEQLQALTRRHEALALLYDDLAAQRLSEAAEPPVFDGQNMQRICSTCGREGWHFLLVRGFTRPRPDHYRDTEVTDR